MKKLLTIGLLVASSVWMVGLGALIAVPAQAASAGDLIKVSTSAAVYYLGEDNKRYIFPNQATYMTWYEDFSGVVTISQSEIEEMTIGGNVTFRPGTKMIKFPTVAKVYAVEPGGVIRHITSEAIATSLYGAEWYKMVGQVPEENFIAYTEGSDITAATYPDGTLVQEEGGSTVYYIEDGEKRPVADETAFNANMFSWDDVLTASSLSAYSDGASITGAEGEIANIDGAEATTPVSSTGTLTVSLSSDTPASTTVVKNSMWVNFTKVNFTASGGDVEVDSVQIKRMGLAQDSNLSNVYLVDASSNEMFGTEKTLSSTHTAYVTKDFTVLSGTTKSFYLAATMNSTLLAGEMASLAVSEVNVKGDASVSGTLPVNGNEMTMNNTIAIGTVTVSNPSLATTATKPVGTTDLTFASIKLTADSVEDVQVEKIVFYQSGTAADDDIANLDLVVDGVVLSTVAEPDDKYVTFDLSASPLSITKGQNESFELKGDIMDGSSRTINFDIYNKADILVKGKTYGFYRLISGYGSSAPYYNMTETITVSTGTLTVSKATLETTNIAEGATQQNLGAFYFNAQGEPIIITQVVLELNTSTSVTSALVSNVTIYDEDGDVVAGPVDPTSGSDPDTITLTDTFTVPTGIHEYIVKGDLDSIDFANGPDADITAKGEVTGNAVTPSPTSEIQGDTVTVKVADLNVSTSASPSAQTVTSGTSGYTFANFVLDATQSGEDVKVTQLKLTHTTSAADIHSYITGISLYDGSTLLNTPASGESSTTSSRATSTITLTDPLIITKSTAKTITIKGDISGSAANNSTHQFGLQGAASVTSYGNSTGNEITEDVTNSAGQTQTIATGGTLRISNSGSNPATGLVIADMTNEMGVFNFESLYEDIEVTKLGFTISTGDDDNINWLYLYDGATKVGEIQVTGVAATITPADLVIPQGSVKTLTLKAAMHKAGIDYSGDPGDSIIVTLTGAERKGKSTGSTTLTVNGLDTTKTNTQYIFMTKPTVTKVSLSGMANGTQDLYKFTLAADSKGEVGFYKASFAITTSSATVTNFKFYEIDGSSETDLSKTALEASEIYTANTANTGGKFVINGVVDLDTAIGSGAKEYTTVGAGDSKSYVLRGDVTGWDANATLQVQLMGDSAASTVQDTDGIDDDASDNFIWSDLNFGYSTDTATATVEWVNAYKVFATTTQSF